MLSERSTFLSAMVEIRFSITGAYAVPESARQTKNMTHSIELLERLSDYPRYYSANFPEREAAIFEQTTHTYPMLAERIDRCAAALMTAGVARGGHVSMLSTPRDEYLIVFLATLRIGAIWSGLNPAQQLDEYRYLLNDFRPVVLFGFRNLRGRDNSDVLVTSKQEFNCVRQLIVFDDDLGGEAVLYADFLLAGDAVSPNHLQRRIDAVVPDDVALVVYTSGSTGYPKGTMLTHKNLVNCAAIQYSVWPVQPLRTICNMPVSHGACCIDITAYVVVGGGTLVFHERFDAERVVDAIARQRISWLIQVPIMVQKMLAVADLDNRDLSTLQILFFGGAAIPSDMISALRELGCIPQTGWGLTEATGAVTFTELDDDDQILSRTVGRPAGSFELLIVDETRTPLGAGKAGEVLVGRPCVMVGYYNRAQATAEAIYTDGWLHTGDRGFLDEEGRLVLVGRMKHMYKSGGYNIYPREIEMALELHPAVTLACVVSITDPRYDEIGIAYLLLAPGESTSVEDIESFARERLANYKIPKQFVIRDKFPEVEVGKVDRIALSREAERQWQVPRDLA